MAAAIAALPYLAAGLGVAALAAADAATAPPPRLVDAFDDDAYYYFEVARHLVAGQGSTFDGLLPTNGYHPLWMLVLLPLFAVAGGGLSALVAVKILCAALFAATVGIVYHFARRLGRELEVACALPALVFSRDLWLSGMETALLLPLLFLAAGLLVAEGAFTRPEARLGASSLTLAAALLARLDLVFFVALAALAAGFLPPAPAFRERLARALRLGLPSAAALLVYMGANALLFGTASPVSGQAKSLGGPFWNPRIFADYAHARPVLGPLFELLPVAGLFLVFVLPALLFAGWQGRDGHPQAAPEEMRGATRLLGVAVAANLCQLFYYAIFSSWPLWRWYYYYVPLALALALALLAGMALVAAPSRWRPALAAALPLLLAAGLAAKLGATFLFQQKRQPAADANYKIQSWAAAQKLNAELPADAIVAMGDRAGAFGYFLDRPLVQVEGLVASKAFLAALEQGGGAVHALLAELGVDYVVYSGGEKSGGEPRPSTDAGEAGCVTFEEPKWGRGPKYLTEVCAADLVYRQELAHPGAMGGATSVWRYRPELNRAEAAP